jgi:hypothetical protein
VPSRDGWLLARHHTRPLFAGSSRAFASRASLRGRARRVPSPDGFVHGVVTASTLIGVVGLCLFAATVASDYSQGTLRNLLVREPRRALLLSGKFLALALFLASRRAAEAVQAGKPVAASCVQSPFG